MKPIQLLKSCTKNFIIALTLFSLCFCVGAKEGKSSKLFLTDLLKLNSTKKYKNSNAESLWNRIRNNFALPRSQKKHHRVQHFVQKFSTQEKNINRIATKAAPYLYLIVEELEKRKMPTELALVPFVESAFEPRATSPKKAAGIWQFIPSTGRQYGLKQDGFYDGRRDIVASTKAALDYLSFLHAEFDNNWMLALAAYNAGEGTVHRAIKRNLRAGKQISFWDLKLPAETSRYVPQILALAEVIGNPEKHDISLTSIQNRPYLTAVDPGKAIDFAKVAKLAEINVKEIRRLNPGYRRPSTHPKGPRELLLPVENAEKLENNLAKNN